MGSTLTLVGAPEGADDQVLTTTAGDLEEAPLDE